MCAPHKKRKPHVRKADNALKTNMVHLLKKDSGIGIHRFRIRYLISVDPNLGEIAE